MIDDGSEASRTVESDCAPRLVVRLQDALRAAAERAVGLHVEEELVRQVRVRRDARAEAESRKLPVGVVQLDHLANGLDGQRVGVVASLKCKDRYYIFIRRIKTSEHFKQVYFSTSLEGNFYD